VDAAAKVLRQETNGRSDAANERPLRAKRSIAGPHEAVPFHRFAGGAQEGGAAGRFVL
jgi:hypothetical protein